MCHSPLEVEGTRSNAVGGRHQPRIRCSECPATDVRSEPKADLRFTVIDIRFADKAAVGLTARKGGELPFVAVANS